MILGVDHVSMSTDDLDRSLKTLTGLGYHPSWIERNLPACRQIKPAVRQLKTSQSIAFCRHPHGVAVELTHHESVAPRSSAYQSLMKGPPPESSPGRRADDLLLQQAWKEAGLSLDLNPNPLSLLDGSRWSGSSTAFTSEGAIQALGLVVPSLDQSMSFWIDGLGCRRVSSGGLGTGERWASLDFRENAGQNSLRVLLVEGPVRAELPMLDDRGMTCLALLTSDIDEDFAWAARHARETIATPFQLLVHRQRFRVGLVRGSAGEIVELIQPC